MTYMPWAKELLAMKPEDLHDPDFIPPKCPSCGVAYVDHLGIVGTCRRLQVAKLALENIAKYEEIAGWRFATAALEELEAK